MERQKRVCINIHGLNYVCICAWVYTHRTTNMTIQNKNLSVHILYLFRSYFMTGKPFISLCIFAFSKIPSIISLNV